MKKLSLFIPLLLLCVFAQGQVTGVKPNEFTEEENPNNANFEFYSQKADSIRRATFRNVQKNMAPQVTWAAIDYVPDSTGNENNLVQFVVTEGDSIFYIDGYGDAILLCNPTDTLLTGSLSADDTLTIANLVFDLSVYRQTIDTAFILDDTLYLSLSGDNEPAYEIDLTDYVPALTELSVGPMMTYTSDVINWASDTLETDLSMYTDAAAGGRYKIIPVATTKSLSLTADNASIQLVSTLNSLVVRDTSIKVVLTESGSNISEFTVTDSRAAKIGMQYAGDYTAGFTTRSIVDQGYVANYVDSALVELYSVVLSDQNNTSDPDTIFSVTIAASDLETTNIFEFECFGTIGNAGSSNNIIFSLVYGATTLWADTTAAIGAGLTHPFHLSGKLYNDTGVSDQDLDGIFTIGPASGGTVAGAGPFGVALSTSVLSGTAAENSAASKTFYLLADRISAGDVNIKNKFFKSSIFKQ